MGLRAVRERVVLLLLRLVWLLLTLLLLLWLLLLMLLLGHGGRVVDCCRFATRVVELFVNRREPVNVAICDG